MVKENGMVMMTEEEYRKLDEKKDRLDIALMELATYRKTMMKIAEKNLGEKNDKDYGLEIPPSDFADMIDKMICNAFDEKISLDKVMDTDMRFVWNGMTARIPMGCEVSNEILPAIKEAYSQYNE